MYRSEGEGEGEGEGREEETGQGKVCFWLDRRRNDLISYYIISVL